MSSLKIFYHNKNYSIDEVNIIVNICLLLEKIFKKIFINKSIN